MATIHLNDKTTYVVPLEQAQQIQDAWLESKQAQFSFMRKEKLAQAITVPGGSFELGQVKHINLASESPNDSATKLLDETRERERGFSKLDPEGKADSLLGFCVLVMYQMQSPLLETTIFGKPGTVIAEPHRTHIKDALVAFYRKNPDSGPLSKDAIKETILCQHRPLSSGQKSDADGSKSTIRSASRASSPRSKGKK